MAYILVIDDEPTLLRLIATFLRRDGHDVVALSEPLAAFDSVVNAEPEFGLVLIDVDMRPVNGFEVVRQLAEKGWRGPVLFMTGHSTLADDMIPSAHEPAILGKPFTSGELRSAVTDALGSRATSPKIC